MRELWLILLAAFIVGARFYTDPSDKGGATIEFLLYVATPALVVLVSHGLRKLLMPYIKMEEVYKQAKQSATGAGLVWLGACLVIAALFGLFGPSARAQEVTTYIPLNAQQHIPTLVQEQKRLWETHPNPQPLQR